MKPRPRFLFQDTQNDDETFRKVVKKNDRIDVCACVCTSGITQQIEFKFVMEVK